MIAKKDSWDFCGDSCYTNGMSTQETDIHLLECRCASLRIQDSGSVDRLAALELERNTAMVMPCSEDDRRWAVIKEAGLIQELYLRHGYSLRSIAQRLGRSPLLIKRRLDLIRSLPDEILELVPAKAANRALVPLARANSDAARILARQPLSTRKRQRFHAKTGRRHA